MLYVDGASNVYGDGLSDLSNAWPFLLGHSLDIPVHNAALKGKSNQHIMFDLINYCSVNIPTFVIIGWQPINRKMIVRRENNYIIDMAINSSNSVYDNHSEFKKYQQLTYKYWSNYLYDIYEFLQMVICIQSFLKTRDIPYVMFNDMRPGDILSLLTISSADAKIKDHILDAFDQMDDETIVKTEQSINALFKLIDHTAYYDFTWCVQHLITFVDHPSIEQHQTLAKFFESIVATRL